MKTNQQKTRLIQTHYCCKKQLDKAVEVIREHLLHNREFVLTVIYHNISSADGSVVFPIVVKEFFNESSKAPNAVNDVHKFLLSYYKYRHDIFSILIDGVSIYTAYSHFCKVSQYDSGDNFPF